MKESPERYDKRQVKTQVKKKKTPQSQRQSLKTIPKQKVYFTNRQLKKNTLVNGAYKKTQYNNYVWRDVMNGENAIATPYIISRPLTAIKKQNIYNFYKNTIENNEGDNQ